MASLDRATVLLLEPEPQVRAAVGQALDTSGFLVIQAATQQEALAALEERSDVRVVVADIDMADPVRGLAFAHEVHHRWPALGLVITSGQIRHLPPGEVPGDGVFIPRPLPIQMFLDVIESAAAQDAEEAFGSTGASHRH